MEITQGRSDINLEEGDQVHVASPQADRYFRINVGGALFQTSMSTLTKRDTMLRAMFSGRMPLRTDDEGWVLIDRSGRHFGLVLDFLRDGAVPLPSCRQEVEQLLQEAKFYLIQDLVSLCTNWLASQRCTERTPTVQCRIPTVMTKPEVESIITGTRRPVIKFMVNRHNNKYSYTSQSDDNILKNLELFDRLAVKFHDRILFVKDLGSESNEVCQWQFYGKGSLRAEVCCTSIVYATDRKQTKVEFPDSKIYDEAMCILRYEERGLCLRCGGDTCAGLDTPTEAGHVPGIAELGINN